MKTKKKRFSLRISLGFFNFRGKIMMSSKKKPSHRVNLKFFNFRDKIMVFSKKKDFNQPKAASKPVFCPFYLNLKSFFKNFIQNSGRYGNPTVYITVHDCNDSSVKRSLLLRGGSMLSASPHTKCKFLLDNNAVKLISKLIIKRSNEITFDKLIITKSFF